jgi:hypothetical protein
LVVDEDKISLTPKAVKLVATADLKGSPKRQRFEGIPENFKGPKLGLDEFYLPKADLFE